ncbi:MAG TPA: YetF domain-containing protein [Gemmatimonadaceae bacterium]|nr:YetF domain-containing protein [Gemmatimonadaceae bacterium]
MDSVLRAIAVYILLLVILRLAGSRTMAQITTFDFILMLIISEAVQQAMINDDNSMVNAFLIVITLVGMNVLMSLLKQRSNRVERLLDGTPLLLIERGKIHSDRLQRERVDEADVLEAARELQGVSTLDDIEYAVLEKNGQVTIVPKHGKRG